MRLPRARRGLANEHFDTLTSMLEDSEAEQARCAPPCRTAAPTMALACRCRAAGVVTTVFRDAVLSTYEYRENPVGNADPGF
jgi:hypothetical protein